MALSELLDSLAKPTPTFHDVDDDFGDNTTAQLSVRATEDDAKDGEHDQSSTKLKRQAASLLSDTDSRYAGRKTTRKELIQDSEQGSTGDSEDDISTQDDDNSDDEEAEDDDDDGEDDYNDDGEDDDDKDGEDDDAGDEDIASFRQLVQKKSFGSNTLKQSSATDDDGGDDDDDDDPMADGYDDDDDDDEEEDEVDDGDDVDEGSDGDDSKVAARHKESADVEDPGVNMLKQISDISSDKQKGLAVQTQLGFLDNLLEGRIKLQRAVFLINQVPQPSTWHQFMAVGKDKYSSAVHTVQNQLCHLLNTLIHLQTSLLVKDTQTRHIVTGEEMSKDSNKDDEDDEEIPSDDEDEVVVSPQQTSVTVDCKMKKKKLVPAQIRGFLAKRARKFEPYRKAVIQKWDTKTRLASGKLNKKSFSALEQTVSKQIEQILYDKERLIKRTQVQRSSYKIYGQPEKESSITDDRDEPVAISKEEQDKNTRDAEIFDDSDYYHMLLQDFIRRKSTSGNTSSVSRQYQEIQQLHDKKKRKVDPRASKGRKLRYDVHKKLTNFMGPIDQSSWTDEARDELYRSLFGQYYKNDQ